MFIKYVKYNLSFNIFNVYSLILEIFNIFITNVFYHTQIYVKYTVCQFQYSLMLEILLALCMYVRNVSIIILINNKSISNIILILFLEYFDPSCS